MATISFWLEYRPIRVGFLVQDNNLQDLLAAARASCLLWGGIYNPIIPVGEDSNVSERLIRAFAVDALCPIGKSASYDAILEKNRFLDDRHHRGQRLLYQDWNTKRYRVAYLDVAKAMNDLWNSDFKFQPDSYKSKFRLVRWDETDDLSHVFTLLFGSYSLGVPLYPDFESLFGSRLRAETTDIGIGSVVDSSIAESVTPIWLTHHNLSIKPGAFPGLGFLYGSPCSFADLVEFWNLRAAGAVVGFLPASQEARMGDYLASYLNARKQSIPKSTQDIVGVEIYHHLDDDSPLQRYKDLLSPTLPIATHQVTMPPWSRDEFRPDRVHFDHDIATGVVEQHRGSYSVELSLPERTFAKQARRELMSQSVAISLRPLGESGYPEHTLKLPYEPRLNEFFSRKLCFDPWALRVEPDAIAIMTELDDRSVTLHPLSHLVLFQKLLSLGSVSSEVSQPGKIARRLLRKMDGPEGGRVLQIRGVRNFLQRHDVAVAVTRGRLRELIEDGGGFSRFKDLYIEAREEATLTVEAVIKHLLTQRYLRVGLDLPCEHCGMKNWLSLKRLDDMWLCEFCGDENVTSLQLRSRIEWQFRKSGLFAKDNNQEGAIPVILGLLAVGRVVDRWGPVYSSGLALKYDEEEAEVDFLALETHENGRFAIALGEAKSAGGSFTREKLQKLLDVRERVEAAGIECFIILVKTADEFTKEESELLGELAKDGLPVAVMSNRELEQLFGPYSDRSELESGEAVVSLRDMVRVSRNLYLKAEEGRDPGDATESRAVRKRKE